MKIIFCCSYILPKTLISNINKEPHNYTVLEKVTDLPCLKYRKISIGILHSLLLLYIFS